MTKVYLARQHIPEWGLRRDKTRRKPHSPYKSADTARLSAGYPMFKPLAQRTSRGDRSHQFPPEARRAHAVPATPPELRPRPPRVVTDLVRKRVLPNYSEGPSDLPLNRRGGGIRTHDLFVPNSVIRSTGRPL